MRTAAPPSPGLRLQRVVRRLRALPPAAMLAVAAGLGLAAGGATSFGQTVLPDAISSFANSSSGWTLLVVLTVALLRADPAWSAAIGTVGFTALTLGYQVVSTARGYPTSELFFLIAGLVVGPFVGVATAWLRTRGWRPACSAALLGGIGLGEGVFGLTVIAATTSPVYWTLVVVTALVLIAVVAVRRAQRWPERLLGPAGALLVAAAFLLAYTGGSGLEGVLDV